MKQSKANSCSGSIQNKTIYRRADDFQTQTNNERSISEILEYLTRLNQETIEKSESSNSTKSKRIRYIYSERSYPSDISFPQKSLCRKDNMFCQSEKKCIYKDFELDLDSESTDDSSQGITMITVGNADFNQSYSIDFKVLDKSISDECKPCCVYKSIYKKSKSSFEQSQDRKVGRFLKNTRKGGFSINAKSAMNSRRSSPVKRTPNMVNSSSQRSPVLSKSLEDDEILFNLKCINEFVKEEKSENLDWTTQTRICRYCGDIYFS